MSSLPVSKSWPLSRTKLRFGAGSSLLSDLLWGYVHTWATESQVVVVWEGGRTRTTYTQGISHQILARLQIT